MAQLRPKALYVGPEIVGDALQSFRPDWDFQPHVPDISSLWTGLADGTIDSEVHILLVLDYFFDSTGEDKSFEQLVATMSPHCFFGIINYNPDALAAMQERIDYEAYSLGSSGEIKYYFIEQGNPQVSIDKAITDFVNTSPLTEIVKVVSGQTLSDDQVAQRQQAAAQEAIAASPFSEEEEESEFLGQVVACTSSKGGSGKSTVAVSLATYLAHASVNSVKEGLEDRPLKVVVLDLDVRDGQIGFLTGNSQPSVIQIYLQGGVTEENVASTVIYSPSLKVDLLLAAKRPKTAMDVPANFYIDLIQQLKRMYDYVILDTSVNYLDPLLEEVAYPMADQIIFVTDIVINSVFSMTRWIQEVTKRKEENGMGISKSKIGIVVNKALSDVNMPGEKIAKSALGVPVITAIPSNPRIVAHAVNMQSMEVLLKHKDLYPVFRKLARATAGRKYKLSDNVA
jgi:MinD-like ATPase involved in chromosome partitioning or flagellar assembly